MLTDDPALTGDNLNTTDTFLREGSGQVGGLSLIAEVGWIGEVIRIGEKAN